MHRHRDSAAPHNKTAQHHRVNGEVYVFLTDEEQEINREIESQNVEISEVVGRASELIFVGL